MIQVKRAVTRIWILNLVPDQMVSYDRGPLHTMTEFYTVSSFGGKF